jgi:hypothetical protein
VKESLTASSVIFGNFLKNRGFLMSADSKECLAPKKETQIIDFETFVPEVSFDLDRIVLEGCYADELSAYRAKKTWSKTLETSFLLDLGFDFKVVVEHTEQPFYSVRCDFSTACGRYAFWRLTHNQAPEIQFIIRTAHIPTADRERASVKQEAKDVVNAISLLERFKNYIISKWSNE